MPKIIVPIYADADRERLRELTIAVEAAERNAAKQAGAPRRGGDPSPAKEVQAAKAAFDAFLDEVTERAEGWGLDHIGFREFRKLLKEHPPRTTTSTAEDGTVTEVTDPADEAWGVNAETFPEALLLFVDKDDADIRTIVELMQDGVDIARDEDKLRKRIKRLSEGQFEDLWRRAYWLNKAGVNDPKLERFSPATPRSNET